MRSATDTMESGSAFCLAGCQHREQEEGVEREGNGMRRKKNRKTAVFLTPAVRHRDVWGAVSLHAGAGERAVPGQETPPPHLPFRQAEVNQKTSVSFGS